MIKVFSDCPIAEKSSRIILSEVNFYGAPKRFLILITKYNTNF